ncbi:enoyl-CoA hydratase/isomerase family protein [Variovorax sp. DAIF25]|uniref:enoyl-CoA hydratase/isomerase family protein n=1 Tax=Variovorax sp. DAIF25 TaxID=3080983 RepID=UPI003D6AC5A1
MSTAANPSDLSIHRAGHTATVEMCRPPHNFFDLALISALAEAFESLQADPACRAIVLAAQGRSFCAGADFSSPTPAAGARRDPGELYRQAIRLFAVTKPVIAAVQGPAVGGGLGLALVADFRVACAEARFSANFARLGFHPGFALSHTLPRLVGAQQAALLLYTGRRIDGAEALRIGLVDELAPQDQVRERAQALAGEIAISAPIAVESTRASLRVGLVEAVRAAVEREAGEQRQHFQTQDFREGVAAMAQRRDPVFGRH